LAIVLYPGRSAAGQQDNSENFDWHEATKFVDTLPFKRAFIDSVAAALRMPVPAAPMRSLPEQCFSRGEVLAYDVAWGLVKAGYMILTASPDTALHALRLGGRAVSRGFLSTFYRMRDYLISTVDENGLYPIFFEQHLREGIHFKSDSWILYNNGKDSLYVKETDLKAVQAPRYTNDYLSLLYSVRAMNFAPGDTFSLPLYADKKIRYIGFRCRQRDTISMDGRDQPCLVIEAGVAGDKKKGGFEVWLSDDATKTPLKIKSKLKVGSITARLIYASRVPSVEKSPARRRDTAKAGGAWRSAPLPQAARIPDTSSRLPPGSP
jgi:hypothetical protein